MAAQPLHTYMCSICGHIQETYSDLCNGCCEFQTLKKTTASTAKKGDERKSTITFSSLTGNAPMPPIIETGIGEFDRVFGEGLSVGSTILLTGDPGIGKTTLLLRAVAEMAYAGRSCVYLSGEQAESSLQQYAKRLGLGKAPVTIATEVTSVESTLAALSELPTIDVLVVDSIQSMAVRRFRSAPGTIMQVKASAEALIRFARRRKIVLIMVGHVTKDKKAAGPEWVRHTVDVAVHLSKDKKTKKLCVLSCLGKNRYGPVDEIGLFTMTNRDLKEATEEDRDLYFFLEEEYPDL